MRGEVRLGDWLTHIEAGKSPMAEDTPAGAGEWGVLKVSAIQPGGLVVRENKVIRDMALVDSRYEVRDDDLLLTRANTEELVGQACVVEAAPAKLLLSDKTLRLHVDESYADRKFVQLALCLPEIRRWVRALATGTSAGMKNIGQEQIRQLPVPDVPLDEQRRIVAAHATFERRIGALERMLGKLRVAEEALSAEALKPRPGWEYASVKTIADVAAGVTLGAEPIGDGTVELPYLRVANVLDGRIDTADVKCVRIVSTQLDRYALRKGDLLLTEGGDLDKLGRGAVWDGRIQPCLHQNHVFRVRCGSRMDPDFLALYTASPEGRAYFQSVGKQTTNLASINSTQVKAMWVPVPPLDEQRRNLEPVRAVRVRLRAVERQIAKLRTIQQGVVEDLLVGRVRLAVV
jgi:type I restriction enzyme S subunit